MTDHTIFEPGNLLVTQERERALSGVLRRHGIESLAGLRIFEAGPAAPDVLGLFVQWGASPANLAGLRFPAPPKGPTSESSGIRMHELHEGAIPEHDETIDIAVAFSLFSGAGNEDAAHGIARELFRVTKPGGLILVYDARGNGLGGHRRRVVRLDDIRRWFPKCPLHEQSLTLAPAIARITGRYAPWLYGTLAVVPLLRTHAMYVLRRPALPPIRADYTPPGLEPIPSPE